LVGGWRAIDPSAPTADDGRSALPSDSGVDTHPDCSGMGARRRSGSVLTCGFPRDEDTSAYCATQRPKVAPTQPHTLRGRTHEGLQPRSDLPRILVTERRRRANLSDPSSWQHLESFTSKRGRGYCAEARQPAITTRPSVCQSCRVRLVDGSAYLGHSAPIADGGRSALPSDSGVDTHSGLLWKGGEATIGIGAYSQARTRLTHPYTFASDLSKVAPVRLHVRRG